MNNPKIKAGSHVRYTQEYLDMMDAGRAREMSARRGVVKQVLSIQPNLPGLLYVAFNNGMVTTVVAHNVEPVNENPPS